MSISDRLDQIEARAEAVVGLTLRDDNARDAYNIVEDDVPDLVAAVRAVLSYLDECDEDSWTPRSSDIRNLLSTTLTEETPDGQ